MRGEERELRRTSQRGWRGCSQRPAARDAPLRPLTPGVSLCSLLSCGGLGRSSQSGILENHLEQVMLTSAGLRVQDRDLVDHRAGWSGRTYLSTAQTRTR